MSRFVLPALAALAGCSGEANLLGDEGLRKCEAGRHLIDSTRPIPAFPDVEPDERRRMRTDLETGMALILEGFFLIDECVQRTGRTFNHGPAQEALKVARCKLAMLDK